MNTIQQAIKGVIPPKHKPASKGWISFNAPCCIYNGDSRDTKARGGLNLGVDGSVVYHCFNCGFKAGWTPGRHFNMKLRKLCAWFGMPEEQILILVFEAMRGLEQLVPGEYVEKTPITFTPKELPKNQKIVSALLNGNEDPNLIDVASYVQDRGFSLNDFDWRWSNTDGLQRRVLIPYTFQKKVVGYTARSIDVVKKHKYIQQIDSDFVFGLDQQAFDNEFVVVLEGVLDAIAVNGCAVLTNEISENKAKLIDDLGKEVIIVPDLDKAGGTMIDHALRYNWSVSFPEWESNIKDAADARRKYGKLYTLRSILAGKHKNKLKIELLRKQYGI